MKRLTESHTFRAKCGKLTSTEPLLWGCMLFSLPGMCISDIWKLVLGSGFVVSEKISGLTSGERLGNGRIMLGTQSLLIGKPIVLFLSPT